MARRLNTHTLRLEKCKGAGLEEVCWSIWVQWLTGLGDSMGLGVSYECRVQGSG